MFRSQHWHLIRVDILRVIADHRLHRLLVVLTTVVAVDMIALDIDHAGTLAKLTAYL